MTCGNSMAVLSGTKAMTLTSALAAPMMGMLLAVGAAAWLTKQNNDQMGSNALLRSLDKST